MKRVICNTCGIEYSDEGSIKLVESWGDFAPCPTIHCPGQMKLEVID